LRSPPAALNANFPTSVAHARRGLPVLRTNLSSAGLNGSPAQKVTSRIAMAPSWSSENQYKETYEGCCCERQGEQSGQSCHGWVRSVTATAGLGGWFCIGDNARASGSWKKTCLSLAFVVCGWVRARWHDHWRVERHITSGNRQDMMRWFLRGSREEQEGGSSSQRKASEAKPNH